MRTYEKISKGKARKLFNEGKEIYLHSSLLSWNNPWQNPMPVTKDEQSEQANKDLVQWCIANDIAESQRIKLYPEFERVSDSFRFYNCDKERGLRVVYLICK